VLDQPSPEVQPEARPADTVSPEPTPTPEPDVQTSPDPTPATTDTPTPDPVVVPEDTPETVAPETGDVLRTEATDEQPEALGMKTSLRPKSRPAARPVEVAAAEPVATPETTPAPTETPPDEAATDEDVAAAIAAAVNEAATEEPAADGGSDAPVGPPMTSGEKEGLRVAIQKCWNIGALSTEAMNTTVTVLVDLDQAGKPITGSISMARFAGGSDSAALQAFEAARRAIIRCGANGFSLPPEKYEEWKELELNFDPSGMRLR
jgi:hypothetical protein